MWAVLIAFGLVGGLVKVAFNEKKEPTLKPAWRTHKLARLAQLSVDQITLDQAEDGAVLSREFEKPELEKRFRQVVQKLKTHKRK